MPKFGKKSRDQLKTCHPKLQRVFNEVIKSVDCTVLKGYRNEEEQNEAYDKGNSKVRFPDGRHNANPSNAINPTDLTILENYLAGDSEYFTSRQKQSADIISNGAINIADFTRLQTISGLSDTFDDTEQTPNEELQLGDINADGQINVVDVVNLVNYILGGDITEEQIALSDYNQDGQVNVVDIVNIVSEILGE